MKQEEKQERDQGEGEGEGEREEEERGQREGEGERNREEEEEGEDIEPSCDVRCPVSHPNNPHNLSIRKYSDFQLSDAIESGCFVCGLQRYSTPSDFFYYCTTCDVETHDGCHLHSKKITHPFHLQHPLTFTRLNTESETNNLIQTQSPFILDTCGWCGEKPHVCVFSCSICTFCLCLPCSRKKPLLTIPNPKSHQHSLSFLPRSLLHPCDVCGLITPSEASYACFQCNYMVHESCIDLPRVIKLTRHPHRLFLTPYLPPAVLPCKVCYKEVDTRYGIYSCNHDDCSYVIHSKCATHHEVWDGREMEWEPENQEETEDVASFKKVGADLTEYFCHEHYLKLEKYDVGRDEKKQCEACILPINFQCFYNCLKCDYSLHVVCAGLPRKLDHMLHKHRLVLDATPLNDVISMTCSICSEMSSGFRYKCVEHDCVLKNCHIDLRCILVPDYFTHKSCESPLFATVSYGLAGVHCSICWKEDLRAVLLPAARDYYYYYMCFKCAAMPPELHYRYDKHPLSLSYRERSVGYYWCEVCERELDPDGWFYTCNICCVTIHLECIFGASIHIKSGSTFYVNRHLVKMISNDSLTRMICFTCAFRCNNSVCFTLADEHNWGTIALCSLKCLTGA